MSWRVKAFVDSTFDGTFQDMFRVRGFTFVETIEELTVAIHSELERADKHTSSSEINRAMRRYLESVASQAEQMHREDEEGGNAGVFAKLKPPPSDLFGGARLNFHSGEAA